MLPSVNVVWLPLAAALLMVFHRHKRGQQQLQNTLLRLTQEFKSKYTNTWSAMTNLNGSELRWNLVVRYASRRQLVPDNVGPTPLTLEGKVRVLDTLLTFLRGHVESGLEARASTIPQAGDGLFTTRAVAEGTLLCVYKGTSLSLIEAMKRKEKGVHGDYVMGGFGPFWRVDAGPHPDVLARYINDHRQDPSGQNARFIKLKQDRVALVVATRDLAVGEEIFAPYGEGFWKNRTAN